MKVKVLYFAALRSFVAGVGLLVPAFALRRPVPQGRRVWLGLAGVGLSAASLGFGVLLSAATVLIYQGSLTIAAEALRPLLSDAMVREMSAVGGLIIVGLLLLEIRRLRIANFLPALAVAPLAAALLERV